MHSSAAFNMLHQTADLDGEVVQVRGLSIGRGFPGETGLLIRVSPFMFLHAWDVSLISYRALPLEGSAAKHSQLRKEGRWELALEQQQ